MGRPVAETKSRRHLAGSISSPRVWAIAREILRSCSTLPEAEASAIPIEFPSQSPEDASCVRPRSSAYVGRSEWHNVRACSSNGQRWMMPSTQRDPERLAPDAERILDLSRAALEGAGRRKRLRGARPASLRVTYGQRLFRDVVHRSDQNTQWDLYRLRCRHPLRSALGDCSAYPHVYAMEMGFHTIRLCHEDSP